MDSTQHRVPNVTPCRQLSAPQQSAPLVQAPCTIEQTQADGVKSQSPQEPVAGPVAVPVAQVRVDSHQPQPACAEQPPHDVSDAQGSGPTHCERSHAQLPQLPVSGPVEEPSEHVPVSPHHPQGKSPVHDSQSV